MTRQAVVTGAAGFIGAHLVRRLVEDGWQVRGVDVRAAPEEAPAHEWLDIDVRQLTDRHVAGADAVFHLASEVGVDRYLGDPVEVVDITVAGATAVLRAAERERSAVVLASTSEVYGRNPVLPWTEEADRVLGSTATDRWCYASAKATSEHLALGWGRSRQLPVTVVRPFNGYGPGQRPDFLIPLVIDRALRGEPVVVHDSGDQTRCFTYVADLVDALVRIPEHPGAAGAVLNLGSQVEVTVNEVVRRLQDLVGPFDVIHRDGRAALGPGFEDVPRRLPDVSRAKDILGWAATTDLDDGLRATVAWARARQR